MKQTVVTFRQAKGQRKLAMLTAYDATVARLMDDHVDAVLVGDSLGMVMLGQPDTLSVTMDQMIHHCAAVSRGLTKPLLVCDMPFMSYHLSPQQACANAGRLVQEGRAQAVKLEGGRHFCPQVEAIVRASIPVMGHLGLTPQSLHSMGGYKVQGRGREAAQTLLDDARHWNRRGSSPSCWNACPHRWPRWSAAASACPPSVSARARTATARCWSGRTCWAW